MFDWAAIENDIGTIEGGDPEAILHEIAHAYDLHGEKAFKYVGCQKEVGNALRKRYPTTAERNEAEFRASVITHLVMTRLGLRDEREDIVSNMLSNMIFDEDTALSTFRDRFDSNIVLPDLDTDEAADAIVLFVKSYETLRRGQ